MKSSDKIKSKMAAIVIPLSIVFAYLIYTFLLGDPNNFVDGDPTNQPADGSYLGFIYKGGPIIIILISFQLILLTYIIERFISVGKASGKDDNDAFVRKIKRQLDEHKIKEALSTCDKQGGSVASVAKNGVLSYRRTDENGSLHREQKLAAIKKDLDEANHLEMPSLYRNLPILSTIASVATLVGLLGTVLGMIQAFTALASVGSPDTIGLANGISQALVTTALGIGTSAVAIIFFNYFSNRIDRISYAIDEATYSILQTFKTRQKVDSATQTNVSHA